MDINKKIIINEYITTNILGKGFSGIVYEAQNTKTQEKVAIKIINKNYIKQKLVLNNINNECFFKNEINILKFLQCEYSCKYLNSFEDNENYYLIMKKYDCDLNKLLEEKFPNGLPIHLLKKCLIQLNKVFKKMNEDKIIHRDIKPGNILIEYINGYNFNFILSDYSFGKYMNDQSKASTVCGTPYYMAPEIQQDNLDKIKYDSKVDIWSLGVTILKMLNKLIIRNLYNEIIPDLNDTLLKDLLTKMLKINPNKRINWDEYFQHDFFKKKIKKYFIYLFYLFIYLFI